MKRGEIYFADLNPTIGSEIKKIRPVLIVSNNANNKASSTITVVPVTSNVKKIYPFEVLLHENESGLSKPSKAQCHQIRTVSKLRLKGKLIACLTSNQMISVKQAIILHLDL